MDDELLFRLDLTVEHGPHRQAVEIAVRVVSIGDRALLMGREVEALNARAVRRIVPRPDEKRDFQLLVGAVHKEFPPGHDVSLPLVSLPHPACAPDLSSSPTRAQALARAGLTREASPTKNKKFNAISQARARALSAWLPSYRAIPFSVESLTGDVGGTIKCSRNVSEFVDGCS